MSGWFFVMPQCFECPRSPWLLLVGALFGLVAIAYVIVSISTTSASTSGGVPTTGSVIQEVAATPMAIMFTRVQISMTVFSLSLQWPEWLIKAVDLLKSLVSLDITAMTAPECFMSGGMTDPNLMFMIKSSFKFFLFPILCVTMMGVHRWKLSRMPEADVARMPPTPTNSMVAAWTFLFITLVTSGFAAFDCKTVRGMLLLNSQRQITCFEGSWFVIALLGVGLLIVYGVIVPIVLWRNLATMRVSHFGDNIMREKQNMELRKRYGWVCERYRPAAW